MNGIFDENEAIEFIKSKVDCSGLSNDDILDIIDTIFDFYDENGELDLDFDDDNDDADADAETIAAYVSEKFADLDAGLIAEVVKAELDYEDSLL